MDKKIKVGDKFFVDGSDGVMFRCVSVEHTSQGYDRIYGYPVGGVRLTKCFCSDFLVKVQD